VRAMLDLEARIVDCELRARGGADLLPEGHRIFLCLEDYPKIMSEATGAKGKHKPHVAAEGVRLRTGDFVEADGSRWLLACQSDHQMLVPVVCRGRRGVVPPHVLRWLRTSGEEEDEPPLRFVDPKFAGVQYSLRQKEAVLKLQTWGRTLIAKALAERLRQARHNQLRMLQRRERLTKELEREARQDQARQQAHAEDGTGVRAAAALPHAVSVTGSAFGGARSRKVGNEVVEESFTVEDELDDDDEDGADGDHGPDEGDAEAPEDTIKRRNLRAQQSARPGLAERASIFLQEAQLKIRLSLVRFMLTRWYGDLLLDMTSPADAAGFEDVIATMSYWHNVSKCPSSQRQRRRTIDQAVRQVR
jgi:hypothetical protein